MNTYIPRIKILSVDPTIRGINAELGEFGLHDAGAVTTLYQKTGPLVTNWTARSSWASVGVVDHVVVAMRKLLDAPEFLSTEITGTGLAQNIPHGLGYVPTLVLPTLMSVAGGAAAIIEGAHDATNIIITATAGCSYRVFAK